MVSIIHLRVAFLCVLSAAAETAGAALPLVPLPASVAAAPGRLTIAAGAGIAVPAGDAGAATAARLLAAKVFTDRGIALRADDPTGPVRLVRDPGIAGAEAYRLRVTGSGVELAASGDAGLLYAAMTLAQLLDADDAFGRPVTLDAVTIEDRPRFAWRGVMLDVARHFQPVAVVRGVIDQMAAHKLNRLHLHLSDDQGWRVEIKRYPALTRVGAWRTPPTAGGDPGPRVGGFYTQDELRALVAYAAERGVTIVPEIDLPGHAQALVAAYPEVGVLGDRPAVSHDWGVNPYLLGTGEPSLAFIEHVLDELMAILPGDTIHLGGDEAIKDQWQASPAVQARMKALGIKTEAAMQGWLIDRLGRYLAAHGRRLMGWDEILEGGLPDSARVMSWRSEAGAVEAARRGHEVVLAPAPTLYMDNLQSDRADEPQGRLSPVTLADLYRFDPLPAALDAAQAPRVLGAEVTAFSEYLVTPRQLEHALYPRLDAFAEAVWSTKAARDWTGFLDRLQAQRARYRREGVADADSAFVVGFVPVGARGAAVRAGAADVRLSTQSGYGTIRYTLDGRVPDARSPRAAGPVRVPLGRTLTAAAFGPDGRATAAPRRFEASGAALLRWTSADLSACPGPRIGLRLPYRADGPDGQPTFDVNLFDACWIAPRVPLTGGRVHVSLARLPRNFGLAHDIDKVRTRVAATQFGELVMRAGGCGGAVLATLPLPDPAASPDRLRLQATLPAGSGDGDICLIVTAPSQGPLIAIDALQWETAE